MARAGNRQVFGLTGADAIWIGGAHLLAVASQARPDHSDPAQCFMTAVVPIHRCGAVPDSHRVPCSGSRTGYRVRSGIQPSIPGLEDRGYQLHEPHYLVVTEMQVTYMLWRVAQSV